MCHGVAESGEGIDNPGLITNGAHSEQTEEIGRRVRQTHKWLLLNQLWVHADRSSQADCHPSWLRF